MDAFPVRTRLVGISILGQPADLVFSEYADKCMLVVTQMPSLGTMQYIRLDSTFQGASTYNITTLLGKRDDAMLTLCARRLAEQAHEAGNQKPMILCLGLRHIEKDTIKEVCAAVEEQRFWG